MPITKQKNTNIFQLFHCQQTQSLLITLYYVHFDRTAYFSDGNQTVCPTLKKINHGLPLRPLHTDVDTLRHACAFVNVVNVDATLLNVQSEEQRTPR
jgi:hypothetical protein